MHTCDDAPQESKQPTNTLAEKYIRGHPRSFEKSCTSRQSCPARNETADGDSQPSPMPIRSASSVEINPCPARCTKAERHLKGKSLLASSLAQRCKIWSARPSELPTGPENLRAGHTPGLHAGHGFVASKVTTLVTPKRSALFLIRYTSTITRKSFRCDEHPTKHSCDSPACRNL